MEDNQNEVLLIAQEECAEVTQAISKVFRFGIDAEHNGKTNRERLTEEVGDLYCMLELMISVGILDVAAVKKAADAKNEKLLKWSNIFKK